MSSTVENIKAKLSITDVVGGYIKLEKAGVNLKARCPFHNEKTPSFYVSPMRGSFHCFGCNKGGDIFTFVEELEGVSFAEALKMLAERAGVSIETSTADRHIQTEKDRLRQVMNAAVQFYSESLNVSPEAKLYLKNRGITEKTIEDFAIGFAPNDWRPLAINLRMKGYSEIDMEKAGLLVKSPKGFYDRFRGRIMFPIFDVSGRPIGFSGRILPGIKLPSGEEPAKYINSPQTVLYDKSKAMYGIDRAKQAMRASDRCILVEGQMDLVMSSQDGVEEVVAVSGTALTTDHVALIKRFTDNLVVVLDADDAGFRAAARSISLAYNSGMFVRAVSLPSGKDPADFVKDHPGEWKALVEKNQAFIDFAISGIASRSTDSRERAKLIREIIYPYARLIKQPLEQEEAFKSIARLLDMSVDSVRADFHSYDATTPSDVNKFESNLEKKEELKTRAEVIFNRLRGIAFWQNSLTEPEVTGESIKKKVFELLTALPGKDANPRRYIWEQGDADVRAMIFEAESYYLGSEFLESEVKTLMNQFALEVLRDRLAVSIGELKKIEKTDDEAAKELLKICQDLSNEINTRQAGSEKVY